MRMRIPLNERCASPAPPRTSQLLYSWGVVFNGVALWARDREAIATAGGLLQGYVPIVWLLIINNALVGLAISAILKFANNLVRVFAHTAAMLLTMFLECRSRWCRRRRWARFGSADAHAAIHARNVCRPESPWP